jgi:tight adherence protein B
MLSMPIILGLLFVGITAITWMLISGSIKSYSTYKSNFTESASTNLSQMFLFIDAKKLFLFNVVSIIVVPPIVYLLSGAIVYSVAAGIFILVLPKFLYKRMARQRIQSFERSLPDSLAQIAGAMRAGATLPMSIEGMVEETKGPISQEFSLLLREHRIGVTLDEAFENMGERVKSDDLNLVITASRIARDVGGNLAEIFERLSTSIRDKHAMEGKIKSLTAQGKMQGWVVGLLPVGMIAILYNMEYEAMYPMFHSIFGFGFLLVIFLLEFIGMIVIKKIVTIDI